MPSLKELGYENYSDYLKSDHWKNIRKKYKTSTLPQSCLVCNDSKFQLHHLYYTRLGKERLTDLVPLCSIHHCTTEQYINTFSGEEKHRVRGTMSLVLCVCFGMNKEQADKLLLPFKSFREENSKNKKNKEKNKHSEQNNKQKKTPNKHDKKKKHKKKTKRPSKPKITSAKYIRDIPINNSYYVNPSIGVLSHPQRISGAASNRTSQEFPSISKSCQQNNRTKKTKDSKHKKRLDDKPHFHHILENHILGKIRNRRKSMKEN